MYENAGSQILQACTEFSCDTPARTPAKFGVRVIHAAVEYKMLQQKSHEAI
jgi:hypothetical protein